MTLEYLENEKFCKQLKITSDDSAERHQYTE